jgi:hypothetical protein
MGVMFAITGSSLDAGVEAIKMLSSPNADQQTEHSGLSLVFAVSISKSPEARGISTEKQRSGALSDERMGSEGIEPPTNSV